MTRTRLSPDERREQLLELGSRLFASRPYEDVWIEEVAEEAGVSRGLLYHYFPNKRAFFTAMLQREAELMVELTAPVEGLDMVEQLRSGIDAYLGYCETHAPGIRMVYNGAMSSDPDVQAIVEADLQVQENRIIAAVSPSEEPHLLLRLAVRSWLAFMRAAAHGWLATPEVAREDVREMCVSNLLEMVSGLPEYARPPMVPYQ